MVSINDLKQDHKNARKRTDRSAKLIAESLQRYGAARSIVIDEDNRILAGNGTIEGAKAAGIKNLRIIETDGTEVIAVKRTGLSEDEKVGLALADNRTSDLSDWDAEMLQQLSEEHDVSLWFEEEDLAEIIGEVEKLPGEENTDPDDVPDVDEEAVITKPGDLWILGDHRLLCGDSTNIQHVERLMDGKKADMVFTDPPYGMNLDTDYTKMGDGGKSHKAVLADDEQYNAGFLLSTFAYCKEIFLWGADYYVETLGRQYPNLGSWIVWDKYSDQERHGLLDGKFGSAFETCWSKTQHKRELARVLVTTNYTARGDETRVHPTQKPVALAEWFFDRWGAKGDIVVDLYGGSGSTLIACERQHRHARLMELDPKYCDVIVKRWSDFTGREAILAPQEE